jgi:hypothetical protein
VNGATTCPVNSSSTITFHYSETTDSGGVGDSVSCPVTESPTGTFHCTTTLATSATLPIITVATPTIT